MQQSGGLLLAASSMAATPYDVPKGTSATKLPTRTKKTEMPSVTSGSFFDWEI